MPEESSTLLSELSHSPSALIQLFNNALTAAPTKKMLRLKGIYQPGKGANYNGLYYDTLKDEATDAHLTLLVPALARGKLTAGKTIEFTAYITKRVIPAGGRIEIHANLVEILAQTQNKYAEKELRSLEIQQLKAAAGYRDVDGFIKTSIVREQRLSITILVGKTAIIDSDIRHGMEEAIGLYNFHFERIGMYSEAAIIEALERFNDTGLNDILVLARGGGENLAIFDSPAIAGACLELEPLFVTAIGHKEDTSLVQRVADKAFITPTALGQYLRAVYNDTIAELENSKAKYTELIKKQFLETYGKEAENLRDRIKAMEENGGKSLGLYQQELGILEEKLRMVVSQKQEAEQQWARIQEVAHAYEQEALRLEQAARKARIVQWLIWIGAAVTGLLAGWWLGTVYGK